jgi:hypothetical protein
MNTLDPNGSTLRISEYCFQHVKYIDVEINFSTSHFKRLDYVSLNTSYTIFTFMILYRYK